MRRWEKKIQTNPYLLKPDQLTALSIADFPFFTKDAAWIDRYLELFAFTKKHGHARVRINERGPLAIWVSTQRRNRVEGKLTLIRQRALHRLNFVWDANEAFWKDHLTALTRFIQTHGHMRILDQKAYQPLAAWVSYIRKRKDYLSPKRRRELERIGFIWDTYEEAWQTGLEELKKFVKRHGHANVPVRSPMYPRAANLLLLGRKLYRARKLDVTRQRELESVGIVWNPKIDLWEERYQQLCKVHRRLGHIRIPTGWAENKTLERWLRRQRGKPHLLTKAQRDKLLRLDASIFIKLRPGSHGRLKKWPL